jgi:hypothetical protein
MEQATTRDVLQELAKEPLGCREFESRPLDENGNVRPEIKAVSKRAAKIWLPQGRKVAKRGACNSPDAKQTDIEDAVEAAGGKRGGAAA